MPYIKGLPAKQLELGREIMPSALKMGIVNNSSDVKAMGQWDEIEAVTPKLDIKIASADVRKPEDIEPAFKKFEAEHVEVVVVLQSNLFNLDSCFHRAATYVYKILKGTPAADLPVEFPTKLELVINLKTAKAIGVEMPTAILLRADEVIE
jgi:putative tryptophan/tyrosine transport system substrate-binding protein